LWYDKYNFVRTDAFYFSKSQRVAIFEDAYILYSAYIHHEDDRFNTKATSEYTKGQFINI